MDRRWYIPFLGALVTFFSSSVYRLSGLLFVNIMEEFNVNRQQASWPVSMIPTGYDMGGLDEYTCMKRRTNDFKFTQGRRTVSKKVALF
ncbi:hypothetical protein HPB47_027642 [Ixodes persulcatus]|uniref:Uncharacterized protein n=1 Tax=Ixodes persulcatus TaxID=34615 RepID=A0AC60PVD0_IXOPE|nr:hypothetical protein HPB47_027642 [Ixodes persulcatus]